MTQLFTLKKSPHFKIAMSKGEKWVTKSFILISCPLSSIESLKNFDGFIGSGVVASKKVGNAICRNKAKRRLREIIRADLAKHGKTNHIYLFIARKEILAYDFKKITKDMEWAIGRLHNS